MRCTEDFGSPVASASSRTESPELIRRVRQESVPRESERTCRITSFPDHAAARRPYIVAMQQHSANSQPEFRQYNR